MKGGRRLRATMLAWPLCLAACASAHPSDCACVVSMPGAWLVDQGWHTELGVPAAGLRGPISVYRRIFPHATVLMFGFGKRTWMTAKVERLSELLMGPFPGPGAIEVVGLRAPPEQAFIGATILRIGLRPAQSVRLSDFIWQSIGKTGSDAPRLISQGHFPGSLFYAAAHGYSVDYTCNSWTSQALQAAGLPVDPSGIVFAAGVMDQAALFGEKVSRGEPFAGSRREADRWAAPHRH